MLSAWRDFVCEVDPDVMIGYNISNFDFPYLFDRAKHLKVHNFPYLGRLKSQALLPFVVARIMMIRTLMPTKPGSTEVRAEVKDTHFSSKAYGTRDSKETKLDGRLQLDMLQVMQRDYKLRSYSLNSVSSHFLSMSKIPDCVEQFRELTDWRGRAQRW